ncbi:MAG: winged helix-turn-helix transcriptional regulator [Candidatus Omnitrophica bacterium]|nr:winged helix-turn-helix transcriptional regulator [Candidatus Omnitrophota bacterium]
MVNTVKDSLDERDFELINIVGSGEGTNQRILAEKMGLSLGLINLLVRRLVTKGFLRIRQLNKTKVEYMLTPKGFTQKVNKSVSYAVKTIKSIGIIRLELRHIIEEFQAQKKSKFLILGETDLVFLVEATFQEYYTAAYILTKISEIPSELNDVILLICCEGYEGGACPVGAVNLVERISSKMVF